MMVDRPYRDDADRDHIPRFLSAASAETAIVLTSADNTAAVRLYEPAGFRVDDMEYAYRRAL